MCSSRCTWACPHVGFPIRTSPAQTAAHTSPELFAVYRVLHRHLTPKAFTVRPCSFSTTLLLRFRSSRSRVVFQHTSLPFVFAFACYALGKVLPVLVSNSRRVHPHRPRKLSLSARSDKSCLCHPSPLANPPLLIPLVHKFPTTPPPPQTNTTRHLCRAAYHSRVPLSMSSLLLFSSSDYQTAQSAGSFVCTVSVVINSQPRSALYALRLCLSSA
jgi:hypothetical protein